MAFVEYITKQGQEYLARMLKGEITLTYTKVAIGDGALPDGTEEEDMTGLVNKKVDLDIYSVTKSDENVVSITAIYDNTQMPSGFYFREKGVFVTDGTTEILFSYGNCGIYAEYISTPTEGVVEKQITSLYKGLMGTETEINITIRSGIYALHSEVQEAIDTANEAKKAVKSISILDYENDNVSSDTVFAEDGSKVTKRFTDGAVMETVFESDTKIVTTLTTSKQKVTKTTVFADDGSVNITTTKEDI